MDADKGTVVWKRSFPNPLPPRLPATGNCPNNLNATPVIDKAASILYVLPSDGKLRGLGLSDGEDKFVATSLVPPYSRNFSLNLIDEMIYTSTARGCANATSEIVAINVKDPLHPVSHFHTSPGKAAGPWGRGGLVKSPYGVLTQTADGTYDPAGGRFGNTILTLNRDDLLVDSFTPANEAYLNAKDLDLGSSSPVVFPFGKWTLVASGAKEGVIYLLDAKKLGGDDHRTPLYLSPRYANDSVALSYTGLWSVMSTWLDPQGKRWLFAPMMGPPAKDALGSFKMQHGNVQNGSLMAFTVELRNEKPVLVPQWISGDLDVPGAAVISNGVVFVTANGERAGAALRGGRGPGRGPGGRGGADRPLPLTEVDPEQPGYEKDAAWRASQLKPVAEGGQLFGTRFTGGREVTHAVLYALDAATGDELYNSGALIDSWNHYGELTLSGGRLYLGSYDARIFAFGLKDQK